MKVFRIALLVMGLSYCVGAQKTMLSGTVYDAYGAVIVGASVTATDRENRRYETKTSDDGVYSLSLPFNEYASRDKNKNFRLARYEITVSAYGFEKAVFKDFRLVPAYGGKMQFDIGLDVGSVSGPIVIRNP